MSAGSRPPHAVYSFADRRAASRWYADVYDAFARGDDRGTVAPARKVNMPGDPRFTALLGRLGLPVAATC